MSRDRARLRDDWDAPRRRGRSSPSQQRPYKRRSVWPWLLLGCAGGIVILVVAAAIVVIVAVRSTTGSGSGILPPVIGNSATYTQQGPPQPVPVSALTAIQVRDNIGDVSITLDASATTPTVAYIKKVRADNKADANKQFDAISVRVQPANTPAGTLSVNAAVPNPGGLFSNHAASVDLAITLPAQSVGSAVTPGVASPATPLTLTLSMSIGNATVNGFSGILSIKNDFGNITVRQTTLADGSRLQTGPGNISFNGNVDTTPAANNAQARYRLTSETGNIVATLPASANVTLDASTNAGTIASDFPINVHSANGGSNYYGPLNPTSAQGTARAVLTLSASTGNVHLNKA